MVNFCMNEQFNDKKMDIFDKLMQWPLLNIFEPFLKNIKKYLCTYFLVDWLFSKYRLICFNRQVRY